jgi:protein-L-isoaspartate(D-aspartate) O-methyltransferase
LAQTVVSLEIFADLSEAAGERLRRAGVANVVLKDEDAMHVDFDKQFDVIAITASLPELSERFIQLLNPEGRLFVITGRPPAMEASLVRMHADGSWTQKSLFETVLTPMINANMPEPFVL